MRKFVESKIALIIVGLIFILFHVIFWSIAATGDPRRIEGFKAMLWLGFTFINIGFILVGAVTFIRIRGAGNFTAAMPIFLITTGYFLVSLLMNSIFMGVNSDNIVVPIVLNAILLILAAVLWFVAYKYFARVENLSEKQDKRMADWRILGTKVINLKGRNGDEAIEASLLKMQDDFNASSSKTVAESVAIEGEIDEALSELDAIIDDPQKNEDIVKLITKINRLLKNRNQIIMIAK